MRQVNLFFFANNCGANNLHDMGTCRKFKIVSFSSWDRIRIVSRGISPRVASFRRCLRRGGRTRWTFVLSNNFAMILGFPLVATAVPKAHYGNVSMEITCNWNIICQKNDFRNIYGSIAWKRFYYPKMIKNLEFGSSSSKKIYFSSKNFELLTRKSNHNWIHYYCTPLPCWTLPWANWWVVRLFVIKQTSLEWSSFV